MISCNILVDKDMHAVSQNEIIQLINEFGDSYTNATSKIIRDSQTLDQKGKVFINCASLILSKFGMTRRGIFSNNLQDKLQACWDKIGKDLLKIRNQINNSGDSRDRYLLELTEYESLLHKP